jgi:hypothetical protein
MYWTFWDAFFLMFILMFIWIPCIIAWVFAMFDVFTRRDLSGWGKAAWLLAIVILPLLGILIYLIFRPCIDRVGHHEYYGPPSRYS